MNSVSADGGRKADEPEEVAGVSLTHPGRIVYPAQGIAKRDLALFYAALAERMLAHAARRPLSLVRCAQGRRRHCFFQKHASAGLPAQIGRIPIEEKEGDREDYLYVEDAAGLVAAVQIGALEFHLWGSRIDRLEHPDRLVFDLDPDEGLSFSEVKSAAFDLRDRLANAGFQIFPLVTGGKGVHLVAPLAGRQKWDEVKSFAKALALRLAEEQPERFTAALPKARRKGRIFIDYLRNERGATAIAPYSTRARAGAPVATPVEWPELRSLEAANLFTAEAVLARLQRPDPWTGYFDLDQSITKGVRRAAGLE